MNWQSSVWEIKIYLISLRNKDLSHSPMWHGYRTRWCISLPVGELLLCVSAFLQIDSALEGTYAIERLQRACCEEQEWTCRLQIRASWWSCRRRLPPSPHLLQCQSLCLSSRSHIAHCAGLIRFHELLRPLYHRRLDTSPGFSKVQFTQCEEE